MARRSFDPQTLVRLREVPLVQAIEALGLYAKRDSTFEPTQDRATERWIVSSDDATFELLFTRAKWFDTREGRGGGGAIDLVAHLLGLSFVDAVKRMRAAGL